MALLSYAPELSPGTDEEGEAQTIKWNLSFTGKWTNGLYVLFLCEAARTNGTHTEFLPKTRNPNLIMSKCHMKPDRGGILPNNWPLPQKCHYCERRRKAEELFQIKGD